MSIEMLQLCTPQPVLARIGKGSTGDFLAAVVAGLVAGGIIWVICRISDSIKARWVKPFPLPPETSRPKFQLRLSDLLIASFLYGAGLFGVSTQLDFNRAPDAAISWAAYLFVSLCCALFATSDLCRGAEQRISRRMMLCGFMLAFSFLFPFALLAWWVWRRWQRVERALNNVERKTLS